MSRILVIGAGKSGVAAANFLAAGNGSVTLADSNREPELPYPLDERVTRAFGTTEDALLDAVGEVVLSPGVPVASALVQSAMARGIPVIGEIELAYRSLRGTVVAVTGSNGKSTTTALIGEILRNAGRDKGNDKGHDPIVAGNIGEPLIRVIDLERPRTYVLELSSFQLETIASFHAGVALLLNVTPDHMDRYRTLEEYAAAKRRVFLNQTTNDTAIVNAALDSVPTPARTWRFSGTRHVDRGAFLDGDELVLRIGEGSGERRIPRASLRLEGMANVENALASWLAAHALGVAQHHVEKAFTEFAGLPHRMTLVRRREGVRWINDSKGTNVDATLKSLEGFPAASVILILGGKDKAGEFERMQPLVGEKVRTVVTIGAAAQRIASALNGSTPIVEAGDMERAVAWAAENAREGEAVLLSPACASFDQYRNFEHRGEHFEELVRGLK